MSAYVSGYFGPVVVVLLLAALLVLGAIEYHIHVRHRRRLRIRIHVNGTRGKSTVTRLIAAGLRAGGLRVIAKTTGTDPRLILEDGSELPLARGAFPSISEQAWLIRYASRRQADAVVAECMAVRPDLQWVSEHCIIRATVGVLTNVRLDHGDVMGPTLPEVAHCLCNTLPCDGVMVTAERRCLHIIRRRAQLVGCSVTGAENDVTDEEMAHFARLEFSENVALALRVCALLGVPRAAALAAMAQAQPDPGALDVIRTEYSGHKLNFVNLLACNDVESVHGVLQHAPWLNGADPTFVLCLRRDRAARSVDFLNYLANGARFDKAIVLGPGALIVSRHLRRRGIAAKRIIARERATAPQALKLIGSACNGRAGNANVVGIGNIVGLGAELVETMRRLGKEDACPMRF